MIPVDYILLLQFGTDEPQIYWERTLQRATSRGNELIHKRAEPPTLALIYEPQSCPARDKMYVAAHYQPLGKGVGVWVTLT